MPLAVELTDALQVPNHPRIVTGDDYVTQTIRLTLALHQGSVLSDRRKGLPWVTWLDTVPFPKAVASSRIRSALKAIPGVASVGNVTITEAPTTRALAITIDEVKTDSGSILRAEGRRDAAGFNVSGWRVTVVR